MPLKANTHRKEGEKALRHRQQAALRIQRQQKRRKRKQARRAERNAEQPFVQQILAIKKAAAAGLLSREEMAVGLLSVNRQYAHTTDRLLFGPREIAELYETAQNGNAREKRSRQEVGKESERFAKLLQRPTGFRNFLDRRAKQLKNNRTAAKS